MHFVYMCRSGQNEELRYSIRSVVKNVPDAQISVVGGSPDWFKGHHIPIAQDKSKYNNVANNITAALNSIDIPENFILMNDDFFILKPLQTIPVLHGGSLYDKLMFHKSLVNKTSYSSKIEYTYRKLLKAKIENPLDYDIHVPFNINKDQLSNIFNIKDTKMLWRSQYGNHYQIGGEEIKDVKIHTSNTFKIKSYQHSDDSIFVSTDEKSFKLIKNILDEKFTKPSRFEQL